MLTGKTIILGVSGSIAAYKIPNLARMLKKLGADVQVIMTKNAENFINPITFETLTGNKCLVDTFDRNFQYSVEHVALAKRADAVMIAPASADVIGKIACGIADDMLTTTVMACPCKKIVSPAMNHNMYHNPIVQDNIKRLSSFGYEIISPDSGMLANGDSGDGRMPEESVLLEHILKACAFPKDLAGKSVLITAGATREAIDPVRFITNHSTGKMGFALARAAMLRGAHVTLVSGHTEGQPPLLVDVIPVTSAQDMADVVLSISDNYDIIIKAAAVADYTPVTAAPGKIKKADGGLTLELRRTVDILAELGKTKRPGQVVCGFSMETENLLENSLRKLIEKNCDMICANSLTQAGAGFGADTNIITLITCDGEIPLEIMTKFDAANKILDVLAAMG
ncbi:MAG: bifunctional phosphopantothenoylcysteine decarboxylase/phosphopantothenate--cysteine ligase CoaBC [Oscillospiraceae bacterium]|nr:bifunctional phosphopantothenoylcysteine decarboxylase/phosphopantothenate--cysteine ligase CoaBC [Oscillospiraceae bacterium]